MESYSLGLFMFMWALAFVLTRIGLFVMFKKAGQPAWTAFLPIVSWWYWIKLVGRPWWYMIGMVIPCINILFSFNITLDLLRSFGQFKFWQHFTGILFTFIYLPILAMRKDLTFIGQGGDAEWRKKNIPKHSGTREWADALLFAAYVAGGMRALFFDFFVIPTPSMEGNLKVGDFLVVSRVKVGMRIPMTPITVPVIAHKELMGFTAFSDWVQLPYMRLPGWYTIKNNDVVVFNWPADGEEFPVDKKDNYVKRCVGIPGDSLKIVNSNVMIRKQGENWKALAVVGKQQKRYLLLMNEPISTDFLVRNDLGDFTIPIKANEYIQAAEKRGKKLIPYTVFTWKENAEKIKKDPAVGSIFEDILDDGMSASLFPDTANNLYFRHKWSLNDYGPVYLPKRGETITLTKDNWDWYRLAVNRYEQAGITWDGNGFVQGDKKVTSYTFKYGYYWMMGDNRYNSSDSRYWGYVPENHVVGKPLFTFFSLKKVIKIDENGLPFIHDSNMEYETKGVRWEKIFKGIE